MSSYLDPPFGAYPPPPVPPVRPDYTRPGPGPGPGGYPPPRVRPFTLLLVLILGLLGGFAFYRFVWDRGRAALDARPVTPRGDLAGDEKATIELFQRASPSVVYITTLTRAMDLRRNILEVPRGTGSGFIWDDAGHVVTNFHVIQGASGAQVTLANHETYSAELVGAAPEYDLAVLRIRAPASKLPPILVGTSNDLQVGQKCFAIGNPFGLDQTLTTGVVSALGRTIQGVGGNDIREVVQTDAPINPGNSGGPLLDSAARLIGVNTAIYSPSGSNAGIGFAVPVDTVNRVVPQLIRNGRIVRPRLPVELDERYSDALPRRALGVEGVMVMNVAPDSPAAAAGVRGTYRDGAGRIVWGDVILAVNGRRVRTVRELDLLLGDHDAGQTVTLTVSRDGQQREVQVPLQPGQYQ